MKCPRKLLAASVTIGVALAVFSAIRVRDAYGQGSGQEAPPQTTKPYDDRGKIIQTVRVVVVPVTVKDSAGELVTDLQKNDFRVFEDGVEQPIQEFSVDPFPLPAAILVDDDLKQSTAEKVQRTL